jgi:hypothetical protein
MREYFQLTTCPPFPGGFVLIDDEGKAHALARDWPVARCRAHAAERGHTVEVMEHNDAEERIIRWYRAEFVIGYDPMNLDDFIDPVDLDTLSKVYGLLAAYAHAKATAMRHRLAGDTDAANATEASAENTYKRLPEWAKW